MDVGLLKIISADCGQLMKMLMTLEPHGTGINFCIVIYFNIVQSLVWKMGDEALPGIIFGRPSVRPLAVSENAHNY